MLPILFLSRLFQNNFVEKNQMSTPNAIHLIIQESTGLLDSKLIESKSGRTFKTVATKLKFDVDKLVEKLKNTVV